jgi:hypothetical protein
VVIIIADLWPEYTGMGKVLPQRCLGWQQRLSHDIRMTKNGRKDRGFEIKGLTEDPKY